MGGRRYHGFDCLCDAHYHEERPGPIRYNRSSSPSAGETMSLVATIFQSAVALAKSDEEKMLLPQLATAMQNIASNPLAANIVAQGNLLLVEAMSDQLKVGQDVLQSIANAVSNAAVAAVPAKTP